MERLHVDRMAIGAGSPRGRDIGPVAARIAALARRTVTLARLPGRASLAPVGEEVETEPVSGFGVQISCAGIDARRHRR